MNSSDFFNSSAWHRVRFATLRRYGAACMACGRGKKEGAILQVDHIRPRSKFPELALAMDNLQVLCRECNMGKSNVFMDDFTGMTEERKRQDEALKQWAQFRMRAYERLREWIRMKWHLAKSSGNEVEAKAWLYGYIRTAGESRMREILGAEYSPGGK